jgi:hypothetical protein
MGHVWLRRGLDCAVLLFQPISTLTVPKFKLGQYPEFRWLDAGTADEADLLEQFRAGTPAMLKAAE